MIEVFWVKDPQIFHCCLERTVMNFLLSMKDVRERLARNLGVGLKPTSAIIRLIHCIGGNLMNQVCLLYKSQIIIVYKSFIAK